MQRYTVIRIFVLLCVILSLVLAVLGVLMPFFETPADISLTIRFLTDLLQSPGFSVSEGRPLLERFGHLVSGPPAKSKMTLWGMTYGSSGATNTINLRDEYFTCYLGNMLIQSAEGMAVVTCVLGTANVIMAFFLLFFPSVVKFPLTAYLFFAAVAAAVTFGFTLHLYLHGWCATPALHASEWHVSKGFIFFVISCTLSLIASVLTLVFT
ncbi:hypothetical protein JKF63_03216 [Porcisia hertigi]|uniref:Uncharacterized protein n=1 Tax=Porcisia hertigi TaxID=2761500 RepID=A0A836IRY7_9TRYP|nr:hypothetical protein JKF63_03216 [Porcisia hertigi]